MRKAHSNEGASEPASPPHRSIARDTLNGLILGGAFGLLLVGVGLFRAILALLVGRHFAPPSPEDARILGYYVGSLALAGSGLGAAKPLLRTPIGTYVGFGLAGAFAGTATSPRSGPRAG